MYNYPPLKELVTLDIPQIQIVKRLFLLKLIVKELAEKLNIEWIGIYRKVEHNGVPNLVKEAYVGSISRAYFPLTEEFAKNSNNSTVAMTKTAIYISNTRAMTSDTPYYTCDMKVQSEFCLPILDSNDQVIGIIDAEAWRPNAFSDTAITFLLDVALKLGESNLYLGMIDTK